MDTIKERLAGSRVLIGRMSSAMGRLRAVAGLGRASVETAAPDTPVSVSSPLPDPASLARSSARIDIRRLSPRLMAALSMSLYLAGRLTFEEGRLLGFQPDLHGDHAATIGKLTGLAARPDQPIDHIRAWDQRLQFALAFMPDNRERIDKIRRILAVLRQLGEDQPLGRASVA